MVWYSGLNEETVMKSIKYNKTNIKKSPVAKNATSQKSIQIYSISDTVNVYLSDCSLKNNEYFGFDLFDYETHETFDTYMDRDKLRGLAVFILNYLENN